MSDEQTKRVWHDLIDEAQGSRRASVAHLDDPMQSIATSLLGLLEVALARELRETGSHAGYWDVEDDQ